MTAEPMVKLTGGRNTGKFVSMRWRDVGARGRAPWLAAVMVLLAGCSAAATHAPARPSASSASAVMSPSQTSPLPSDTVPPVLTRVPKPAPSALPVDPGAGRLPQTQTLPTTKTVAFRSLVHDLWLAVTTGKAKYALPAFFPEAAYKQVKAIPYPDSDWQYRLWYDFTLDVAAVHPLLGKNAKLVKVIVLDEYAAWIPPGACYKSIGYWHMPGSRVVYRQNGQVRSFGIASMISWRGDWYVIHFGAVLRSGSYGEVDDPTEGEGYPGPPGGC